MKSTLALQKAPPKTGYDEERICPRGSSPWGACSTLWQTEWRVRKLGLAPGLGS